MMMRHVYIIRIPSDVLLKLLPGIGGGEEFKKCIVLSPQDRFQIELRS